MQIKLQRVSLKHDSPTYGVLLSNDIPICLILERPWRDNLPSVSCIPEGKYECVAYESEKFGKTWEVTNVPMRTYILFHSGNTINDSQGCLLAGLSFSPGGISHSKDAMALLRRTLPPKFTLEILNPKET